MPDNVKEDLLLYVINVLLLNTVQLLIYNSEHSVIKIFRVNYC